MKFHMFKLNLEKVEEPEIKLPTSIGSSKNQESSRKISTSAYDYTKCFECMDHNKLQKILKDMGITDHLTCLLRNLYANQEKTVRTDLEQLNGYKSGKEYIKVVYCHPTY